MGSVLPQYQGAVVTDNSRITANMPPISFTEDDPTYRCGFFITSFPTIGLFAALAYNGRPLKLRLVALTVLTGSGGVTGQVQIATTSTANTGGTASTPSIIILGPNGAVAPKSIVYSYTAAPTPGSTVGLLYSKALSVPANSISPDLILDYSTRNSQPPLLMNSGDTVALVSTAVLGGSTVAVTFEWTEAKSGRGIGP